MFGNVAPIRDRRVELLVARVDFLGKVVVMNPILLTDGTVIGNLDLHVQLVQVHARHQRQLHQRDLVSATSPRTMTHRY